MASPTRSQPAAPAISLPPSPPQPPVLRFIHRGAVVSQVNVAPDRTLLDLLREDMACTSAKEGCGEGDCGACTVVLADADPAMPGSLRFRAVNSCIRLAHSIDGMALFTAADIAQPDGTPHPAQQAMVACHASQCGFCTPGFVMGLFAMHQNHLARGRPITRALAQEELSGNLCRCTGYRPILEAAQTMQALPQPPDGAGLLQAISALANGPETLAASPTTAAAADTSYHRPSTLAELLRLRAARPAAQLVAGCTDVGLWITKQHAQYAEVIDLTRVAELGRIERYPQHLAIGAGVPLADAFAALLAAWPQLGAFASRFAGLAVRNSGTLGGNVANGSPIGDSMPLLIALGAHVVLASARGHRHLPLERLYTGYRQTALAADEVLAWITVPLPLPAAEGESALLQAYKISKRFDDDISAVCLAVHLRIAKGRVVQAAVGAGGVAATPARAPRTEAALLGQPWEAATVQQAMQVLRDEFMPLSDHRASADYRRQVLGNLLQRFWRESQGQAGVHLHGPQFHPDALDAADALPEGAA
jgi:xanthine dehydrogenase small subunit